MVTVMAALLVTILTFAPITPTRQAEAQGSFDQQMINLINDHREANGLSRLAVSTTISAGAQGWSQTMINTHPNGFFHDPNLNNLGEIIAWSQGPTGFEFATSWVRSAPLPSYCTAQMDYTSAEFFVCGWLDSPPHRAIVDTADFKQIGSGTATSGPSNARVTYATQRFSFEAPAAPAAPIAATPASTTPTTISVAPTEPGHSIEVNDIGDRVVVGLKADGALWARRTLVGSGNVWRELGNGQWVAADVAINPTGSVHIAATRSDGTLFTGVWANNGAWSGWVNHGGGWETTTCLLYTSPSPRDATLSRMPSSA